MINHYLLNHADTVSLCCMLFCLWMLFVCAFNQLFMVKPPKSFLDLCWKCSPFHVIKVINDFRKI